MNTITISQNGAQAVSCDVFLTTLYRDVPADLWLEIRCIHPVTTQVRSLWAAPHDEAQRSKVLKQASQLNRDGYGIYFAPCLRSAQKGSAQYAALAPALWIDIDCEEANQRASALEKLQEFDPLPSVIVDSGGGWHGYWLLDTPYLLDSDGSKEHIAHVLRGLFAALGGDEGYVKSVASVMRLPGSINTKPERGGAIASVEHWSPESRYPLSMFDWLKVDPSTTENKTVFTLNGRHPLPPRTEDYLSGGAADGNRNNELFAAACQLRDAGYSQSEAESQLITRHVADSTGGENAAGREREAKATIASAYSQPPREPIASSRQQAQRKVNRLVEQYGVTQKDVQRPSIDELTEAITACARSLNPLEWAEQRNEFKAFTGDGLRISDIDRLYRQKRKEIERQQRSDYVETEGYFIADERMIYRRETYKGPVEKTVADWTATVLYQTCQIDDNGREMHVTKVELQRDDYRKTLDIPGDIFVDDKALRRFIGASAGSQFIVRAGMSKHLVPAIIGLSGGFKTHRHFNFMGWRRIDDRWTYVTPCDCIRSAGKMPEPPSVELDGRLNEYGLTTSSWKKSADALEKMIAVLPPKLAPGLLSFALLPLLYRFMPDATPKPAMQLVGTSGSGKSEIAALMNSFYGNFSRDTPPAQWGDTINTVEIMGYPLADALYWVDDYKEIYADKRTFTRFMQSYSRKMGRGRLTREAKIRTERPCRGFLLSTGETTLEGEMSVKARMFNLEIPPWEQRDPRGQALRQAEAVRHHLSGFTAHFASWLAQQVEQHDLIDELASRYISNIDGYDAQLTAKLGKKEKNTNRVVKNWSVLITVYQLLRRFMREKDADDILPAWDDVAAENVKALREERASEIFLNQLGQLLGGGQVVIDDNMRNPNDYPSSVTVVGYQDDRYIYLLPDIALREVNRLQPLHFTATAIGMQLREDGLLIPGSRSLTTQKRVRGSRVRFWQLTAESLLETVETTETDS